MGHVISVSSSIFARTNILCEEKEDCKIEKVLYTEELTLARIDLTDSLWRIFLSIFLPLQHGYWRSSLTWGDLPSFLVPTVRVQIFSQEGQ